jgi:hypothetical protein
MAMNLDQTVDTITPSSGTLTVSGTNSATSFSGAGTGLTGTAAGLSISGNAGSSTNIAVADASTNANYFLTFVGTTGSNQPLKTASSTLKFNPSTGALSTGSVIYIAP